MFCSSLPFSTLEHHWWHTEALKLPANHLSSSALSPSIIRVKGCCASQLMSHSETPLLPPTPTSLHKLPQFIGKWYLSRTQMFSAEPQSSTSFSLQMQILKLDLKNSFSIFL